MVTMTVRREPLRTRRAAEAAAAGLPPVAAKARKRKARDRMQLQGLLDANKDAIAKGGAGAPRREILAYPIESAPSIWDGDDIPF